MGLRGLSGTSLMSEASMAISEARSPPLDQPAARTRTLSSSPCVASPRELLALNTTLSEPSSSAVAVSTDSMASDSALQTSGVSTPRASCTRCSSAVAASKAEGGGGGAVAEPAGSSELELLLLPNGHGGNLKGQSGNAEQVTAFRRPVAAFGERSSVTAHRRLAVVVKQASSSAARMTTLAVDDSVRASVTGRRRSDQTCGMQNTCTGPDADTGARASPGDRGRFRSNSVHALDEPYVPVEQL